MIRSYTVDELERMSGVTRRTISDYIAKGLLAGPSHRGRGARYPQADADALRVVPRIRTLMKKEFPTVESVARFMRRISRKQLRDLACQPTETELVLHVRRIRVGMSLVKLLPRLSPERLAQVLDSLSPDQISGIDRGQYQLGAVLDLAALFAEGGELVVAENEQAQARHPRVLHSDGHPATSAKLSEFQGTSPEEFESILSQAETALTERRKAESRLRLVKPAVGGGNSNNDNQNLDKRLMDIVERLGRLEKMIAES